jgi:hypothetical protein
VKFVFRGGTRDGQVHEVHYTARYIIVPIHRALDFTAGQTPPLPEWNDQRYKLTTIRDEDGHPVGHEYVLEEPSAPSPTD